MVLTLTSSALLGSVLCVAQVPAETPEALPSTDQERPPRPVEDFSEHPRTVELDELCAQHGFGRLPELDVEQLSSLIKINRDLAAGLMGRAA